MARFMNRQPKFSYHCCTSASLLRCKTPLTGFLASELSHEVYLIGWYQELNVVSGFCPTPGSALASHMDVDKVAFSGSTETGKSPLRVCEDADVDKAGELAHFALLFNQVHSIYAISFPFKCAM
ncbi:unnamed protein product [Sphenostylis stenocarpa]|uniref:Aldehyde dehydrogenase domain-containing protein n=1 Tax=Sphenostylis stenocarpa TaxID=92480 RepID=A0AA86SY38_9FABA|nr:unnamed protein product [Sphenostylis stenocarpa]